jgi:excisionase family DNA binding protein
MNSKDTKQQGSACETTKAVTQGALKLKQAANYLGVSAISVRRLIKRGLIKPNRALRHLLIPLVELDRFLNTRG